MIEGYRDCRNSKPALFLMNERTMCLYDATHEILCIRVSHHPTRDGEVLNPAGRPSLLRLLLSPPRPAAHTDTSLSGSSILQQ